MNAGSLSASVMVLTKRSAEAASGAFEFIGMCTKLMAAALAAAASPSISAPGSLARRRLMIDANPIFLIPATDEGVTAPAQATVVCTCAKLVIPGIVDF